jgi:hypothetical protein
LGEEAEDLAHALAVLRRDRFVLEQIEDLADDRFIRRGGW